MREKNFKITKIGTGEFESIISAFSGGGAYISAPSMFVGRKVKVVVLPEDEKKH